MVYVLRIYFLQQGKCMQHGQRRPSVPSFLTTNTEHHTARVQSMPFGVLPSTAVSHLQAAAIYQHRISAGYRFFYPSSHRYRLAVTITAGTDLSIRLIVTAHAAVRGSVPVRCIHVQCSVGLPHCIGM